MPTLDDDGLPALAWHGATVETLTTRNLIVAVLDAIGFRELDGTEEAAIIELICQGVGGKVFQRRTVRRIVAGYRREI